jgi:hypothetical protein
MQYKFNNLNEEKNSNEKIESTVGKNKYIGSTLSATPRIIDSSVSGLNALNINNTHRSRKRNPA